MSETKATTPQEKEDRINELQVEINVLRGRASTETDYWKLEDIRAALLEKAEEQCRVALGGL